ncbi:proteinase-activated receptor 3-like [Tachysurus vachellii]|uniref:proteinase-activated receptor 3-like n=1 Tax=Tachysurus vachellii TaxID=175792 RepID=UPI00296ADA1F|nr:proteinase-activated receptor 3-like [Tachysurus vachellii]
MQSEPDYLAHQEVVKPQLASCVLHTATPLKHPVSLSRLFIMEYTVPNGSYGASISPSGYSLKYNTSVNSRNLTSLATLAEIIDDCNKNKTNGMRAYIQILNLVTALPANVVLLWLLLKNRKTMSPSEVLGLNFAILGVLFCLSLPLDISMVIAQNRSGLPLHIVQAFATLSYFGCPLLLTSMCLERYVAVTYPVLFMKLGKREYRAACSAIIWFLTCIMAAFMFVYTIANMALILSTILNVLFLVMVACLVGIVCVLSKKGPGEGGQNNSSIKKHALKNVVAILVPSTITYFPMLGLAPFLLIIQILEIKSTNRDICQFLMMFAVLPNFGICLGPMFYMARVKQMFCSRNNESGDTKETTTVQKM